MPERTPLNRVVGTGDAWQPEERTRTRGRVRGLHGGGLQNLFSTHPATEERIARLMEMARTGRFD